MATTLKATLRVDIDGASSLSATHTIGAEAYDRIDVTVPTGSPNTATVEVQPGSAGQVQLLLITASAYPDDGSGTHQLTYEVDSSGSSIDLDAPLLVVGTGAVGQLGAVNEIVFTNASDDPVDVSILVGRTATT